VLLARGLQQRLDAAYHLTVALLGAGIIFSLLKGFDYEEAIALSVMLGVRKTLLSCTASRGEAGWPWETPSVQKKNESNWPGGSVKCAIVIMVGPSSIRSRRTLFLSISTLASPCSSSGRRPAFGWKRSPSKGMLAKD
jgi:lysylphosphatidylglycerol synthetase-like protein (DUF2156 family)